ncbi:hypothetical protein ACT1UH_00740 [Mycoplasma sp. 332]|uniref:hypothetical protein n=1 Tax=unclassified Asterococcus (in: mycoplasmas, genus) TaxID=3407551 RepID=UPI003F65AA20
MAQKQKDTRTLNYDPESDNISRIITEFQSYKKNAKFFKDYSEMEIFNYFQKMRFMNIMDERNKEIIKQAQNRQTQLQMKYQTYIEFDRWSDSPQATQAKPISKLRRILAIIFVIIIQIIVLIIIIKLANGNS